MANAGALVQNMENTFECKTRCFHIKLHGAAAVGASIGLGVCAVGLAAYASYKILNNEQYMEAILLPLHLRGALVRSLRNGSLVVEVVAENDEVANRIREGCTSGEILREINKRLKEYEAEFKQEVGRIETIEIVKEEDLHMSQEEWEKAKIQYQNNIKETIENGQKTEDDSTLPRYEEDTTIEASWITQTQLLLKTKDTETSHEKLDPKSAEKAGPKSLHAADPKLSETGDPKLSEATNPKLPEAANPKLSEEANPKPLGQADLISVDQEYVEIFQQGTYEEKEKLVKCLTEFKKNKEAGHFWEFHKQGKEMGNFAENFDSIFTNDFYQVALSLKFQEKFCDAVLFFYVSIKRAQKEFDDDEMTLRVTSLCLKPIVDVIKTFHENNKGKIVDDFVILIVDFINESQKKIIQNNKMNENSLRVSHQMALCYILTGNWKQCTAVLTEVLTPPEATKVPPAFKVLGYCYTNLGFSYYKMKDYGQARTFYAMAVKTLENATDFAPDEDKMKHLEIPQRNLNWLNKHAHAGYVP